MVSMDHKTSVKSFQKTPDLQVFVRNVRDMQGKKRTIAVRPWATVKDVKDILQQLILVPANAQRLYYGPLLTSGKELPNHRTLYDAGIDCSGKTILLDLKDITQSPLENEYSILSLRYPSDICISSSMYDMTSKPLRSLVQHARNGLAIGLKPNLALEGSGGTYFIHDSRKNPIAVFKPADEEPYADNNPRGYIRHQPGDSLRKGIVPGEACIREVAAFLLDHNSFSGVPMTTLVEARHPAFNTNGARLSLTQGGAAVGSHSVHLSPVRSTPASLLQSNLRKPGSFQEFVKCEFSMDDISPSKISVDEVHKIAILDIRIMNADRNAANLICRRNQDNSLALVPIDHGYCLRSVCDVSWMDWCWLDWPQLKQPLSEKTKNFVKSLNIDADAHMLKERLNICEEAVNYFRASSALLKAGVAAGLSLYEIAIMCCRNDDLAEAPSMMEKLFDMASELAQVAVENERWHHTAASRAIEEQLSHVALRPSHPGVIRKSSSSVEFHTLPRLDSDVAEESPGLIKSSASDTSSDTDDRDDDLDEKEDCEKWAEQVIADVNIIPNGRPHRSGSVSSSSSEEGSQGGGYAKGFWHVSPGFNIGKTGIDSDDSSIAWSEDNQTPRSTCPSLDGNDALTDNDVFPVTTKKTRVSFALPDAGSETFRPPSTVSVASVIIPLPRKFIGGMVRSRSYAGQLDKKGHPSMYAIARNAASHGRNSNTSEENYKKYFYKFIDLVIVRETKAALHHSRQQSHMLASKSM